MAEVDDETVHDRIVRLAFNGDEERFQRFVDELEEATPGGCQVILRGSAVTGIRWEDGQPFDADGPGTSDLDVTFLSGEMLDLWNEFYIPKLHTAPLHGDNPEACPSLLPLRERLCRLAGRPVNLQASTSLVQFIRDVLFDHPYYTLIERADDACESPSS